MASDNTGSSVHFEKERGVTEVVVAPGIAHFVVRFSAATGEADVAARRLALLQAFAEGGVPVFLMKLHPGALSFAVRDEPDISAGVRLLEGRGEVFAVQRDLALLSIIAGAMRDMSGVMSAIYEALVGQGVTVCQTADAYNAVHLLVPGEAADRGAAALCERFACGRGAGDDGVAPAAGPAAEEGVGLKPL